MRRSIEVKIDSGRDAGKTFVVTEKSAYESLLWAEKAKLLLPDADIDIFSAGIGSIGWLIMTDNKQVTDGLSVDNFNAIRELQDDLLDCVKFKNDNGTIIDLFNIDIQIEDVSTLKALLNAVLAIHADF